MAASQIWESQKILCEVVQSLNFRQTLAASCVVGQPNPYSIP